jgi:hypothetical protein
VAPASSLSRRHPTLTLADEKSLIGGSQPSYAGQGEQSNLAFAGLDLEVHSMSVVAAVAPLQWGDVLVRLGVDLAAIAVLAYGVYFRRHGRRDLFVIYAMFNVGLFLALVVMVVGGVGVGVGFGLFAVLSIVRLRSEPFSNVELGYFFVALVVALVCGLDLGSALIAVGLSVIAVAAAAIVDHPRLLRPTTRTELVLEVMFADEEALRRHVEERLNADVTELSVLELDYVREITRVAARYVPRPRLAPTLGQEALDGGSVAARDR